MDPYGGGWPASPLRGGGGGGGGGMYDNISNDGIPMDALAELQDTAFEPQTRARSNTWPLPRPENFVEPETELDSNKCSNQQLANTGSSNTQLQAAASSSSKKNSSRRNAWGNLSYADLITQAISSAADSRLTLSQIYEWLVQNVPYFKDKGDSNSSAGWKVRKGFFIIRPIDPCPFLRGRGQLRVYIRVNCAHLCSGDCWREIDGILLPSASRREGRVSFPFRSSLEECPLPRVARMVRVCTKVGNFQLSPDFRQRASSNASSCGRLSPIQSIVGVENAWPYTPADLADNPDPSAELELELSGQAQAQLDQLAGSLADELTLQHTDFFKGNHYYQCVVCFSSFCISPLSITAYGPPHYWSRFSQSTAMHNQPPPPPYQPPQPYSLMASVAPSYGLPQQQNHPRDDANEFVSSFRVAFLIAIDTNQSISPSSGTGMSPSYPHSEPSPDYAMLIGSRTLMGQVMEALNSQTNIDDININNVESFPCVDEVLKHELSLEGSLDFSNLPLPLHNSYAAPNNSNSSDSSSGISAMTAPNANQQTTAHNHGQYAARTSVTPPSWVH
ncbi:putative transcription factor [Anopheles sinensis]|uniref:Putative transcription factor n=1 Tax=Anopheles sinensis TaxID=74873 RepID=A0A084VFY5_ANOSI|nr:putative transcription factor [Anopheles sinensis]